MRKMMKNFVIAIALFMVGMTLMSPVKTYAAADETAIEEEVEVGGLTDTSGKAIAAAIAIGLAACGGAVAMGLAVAKSSESIARQPEAEGNIRTTLMLGLVFIETAIIYALLAVIMIIFVL